MEQGVDIGGAVVALTLLDWRLGATCALILVPMFLIGRQYHRKVSFFQKQIHDQQEDLYNVYATQDPDQIRSYYSTMAHWKQKTADWGALNFGVLRIFLIGIFLAILFVAIDLDNFSTGNIYAIAAYVWTFVTSSEYLPEQLESLTSVRDIIVRLEHEGE
jgi:ABC-type multidrug transport system fused ATPase/permease subunit